MEPFIKLTGIVLPMDRANVDTDQIIPAVYLKRIERTGFGQFLFSSWRFNEDGSPNQDFILNQPKYQGATILVGGDNFGSGSSREHAPWALLDYGFRVIIATSLADIFHNNCLQNGMLPLVMPEDVVNHIMGRAKTQPGYKLTVDLEQSVLYDSEGFEAPFQIDEFRRHCLLNGLDDIGLTLQQEDRIKAYEERTSLAPIQ